MLEKKRLTLQSNLNCMTREITYYLYYGIEQRDKGI